VLRYSLLILRFLRNKSLRLLKMELPQAKMVGVVSSVRSAQSSCGATGLLVERKVSGSNGADRLDAVAQH
jgi:hypothetical protein